MGIRSMMRSGHANNCLEQLAWAMCMSKASVDAGTEHRNKARPQGCMVDRGTPARITGSRSSPRYKSCVFVTPAILSPSFLPSVQRGDSPLTQFPLPGPPFLRTNTLVNILSPFGPSVKISIVNMPASPQWTAYSCLSSIT